MRLFCTEKGLQISGYRFLIIVLKVRLVVIIAEKKYAGSPRHYFKTPPKLTQFYKKVHFFCIFFDKTDFWCQFEVVILQPKIAKSSHYG